MSLRDAIAEAADIPRRLKRRVPEHSRVQASADAVSWARDFAPTSLETGPEFLGRMRAAHSGGQFQHVSMRDLRVLIDCVWSDPKDEVLAFDCVRRMRAVDIPSRRLDGAMLQAYFRRFPEEHPRFPDLVTGCLAIAGREGSIWQNRSKSWNLFEPQKGPQTVAMALLNLDPQSVVNQIGLNGDLLSGGFMRVVWRNACALAADTSAGDAPARLRALVRAAGAIGEFPAEHPYFARAMLKPWLNQSPRVADKRFIMGEMVGRLGDPRLNRTAWLGIRRELETAFPSEPTGEMIEHLRFWLVENAVHQFLDVVDHDADPEQWPYRKAFWLSYLKAGHVKDAWVVFGPAAADRARDLTESKSSGRLYADLSGGYEPSQSVLLMRIDNLIVGDWSHTGQCRFWTVDSTAGQKLTNDDGSWRDRYSATQLRTLDVHQPAIKAKAEARARADRFRARRPDHEEAHSGAKSFTWQRTFNEVIGELTDFRVQFEYDSLYPHERNTAWDPIRRSARTL